MSEERYLTVYRGGREQRAPRPFSPTEEKEITRLALHTYAELMFDLTMNQQYPRFQRLLQEAIERKRRWKARISA